MTPTEPTTILDASAVLAYLQREPGSDSVRSALESEAAISTVNLTEVYARVVASGRPVEIVASRLPVLGLRSFPFTEVDALTAAQMYPDTRPFGLSLGDRACLALALRLRLPVLTADRTWANLGLAVDVRLIR